MRTRRKLRGSRLLPDCSLAKTVREENGDIVCGGLHREDGSFFLCDADVIDRCRGCGAWHVNVAGKAGK